MEKLKRFLWWVFVACWVATVLAVGFSWWPVAVAGAMAMSGVATGYTGYMTGRRHAEDHIVAGLERMGYVEHAPPGLPGEAGVAEFAAGIETKPVRFYDVFEGDPGADGDLELIFGVEIGPEGAAELARPVVARLSEIGHVLIGGAPRSGKSVLTRGILFQALLSNLGRSRPAVLVAGIDLTGITLNPALFAGLSQLFGERIAADRDGAEALLTQIEAEAARREALFRGVASLPEKLSEYNAAVGEAERLPVVLVVVEEFGALSLMLGRAWQQWFTTLVWRVAKYGFHFVCLSQELTKQVVGPSRDAFLARFWFRYMTAATREMLGFEREARVTLDAPGRGLVRLSDRTVEFQGLLIEKQQLIELVQLLKEQARPA